MKKGWRITLLLFTLAGLIAGSGWIYYEELRLDDDPRLALCWDKVGLGHNGQRLSDGGRFVIFANNYFVEYIEGSKWTAFLEEQKKLLEEREEKRANKPAK